MMRIDSQTEPLVREAFGAAVARDTGRFRRALKAIGSAGDNVASESVHLALIVDAIALHHIHQGAMPDSAQIRELTKEFCEMEEWPAPDESTASAFLESLANQSPVEKVLPPEQVSVLVFLVGAWLLASFLKNNQHWNDYLDNILDSIEAHNGR
jgi:hypothetical protein